MNAHRLRRPFGSESRRERAMRMGVSTALGALAVGALATGAGAIGALAIGRLAIARARIRALRIEDLEVRRLRVHSLEVVHEVGPGPASAVAGTGQTG
jgi:hypothetical protein